jgi:hypothetical protein
VKNQLQTLVDKRFKQVQEPAQQILDLAAQARSVLQVVEAERFIEAFLSKTAEAFEPAFVIVRLKLPGQLERRFETGDAGGLPDLILPLLDGDVEADSLVLGPRAGGRPYSAAEIEALRSAASVLVDVAMHSRMAHKPAGSELSA